MTVIQIHTQIQIYLFKQKSGHTDTEDTDEYPTNENNTIMKHAGLCKLHTHKRGKVNKF